MQYRKSAFDGDAEDFGEAGARSHGRIGARAATGMRSISTGMTAHLEPSGVRSRDLVVPRQVLHPRHFGPGATGLALFLG